MQSTERKNEYTAEREKLKFEQRDLKKQLDSISERIIEKKKFIRSLDPKWNSKTVINEHVDMLSKYREQRIEIERRMRMNATAIKELGKLIFGENQSIHEYKKKHKEIRQFNKAFTARIHAYERREALKMVEEHNKAFLGEVDNEKT